jgi:uncharacterized protein YcbX
MAHSAKPFQRDKEVTTMSSETVGSVASLWRFPVKSMKGEPIDQAELTARGLVGDRAYALIDVDTGKVVSAKSVKLFPRMLDCRAAFVEPPKLGDELPPVRITLPDSSTVTSDSADAAQKLSSYFGRNVRLTQAAPADFTIDMYHPDIEEAEPATHRDIVVEQKLGSAYFAEAGLASPVPVGAFFDLFPLSVVTNSTLNRLNEIRPESRFDARRFRMNVIVDAKEVGFVENGWVGREITIGDAVRLQVAAPDSRCVMTTLAQDELPKDNDILRTLAQHNMIQVGDAGRFPCVGVYAVVEAAGALRIGDKVSLS